MQTIKQTILTIIICLAVVAGVSLVYSAAPACNPPDCNAPAPINASTTPQIKEGPLGIGGAFKAYSASVFEGTAIFNSNVGIGTNAPSYKLSLLGDTGIGLLRTPGDNVLPGAGPAVTLESPSNNTSSEPVVLTNFLCSCGGKISCPTDTTPTKNTSTSYSPCVASDAGNDYVDVQSTTCTNGEKKSYASIRCQTGTDKYTLRTNAGTLEFLNTLGSSKMTIGQDGVVKIYGGLSSGSLSSGSLEVCSSGACSKWAAVVGNYGNDSRDDDGFVCGYTLQELDTCDNNMTNEYTCPVEKTTFKCKDIYNYGTGKCNGVWTAGHHFGRAAVTCKRETHMVNTVTDGLE